MRFIALISFIITFSAQAAIPCLEEIKDHYEDHGQASDYPVSFRFKKELKAGDHLTTYWGEVLAVAAEDSISIEITGSYHSGWFSDEMIVNPLSCKVQGIYNTYSE